MKTNTIFECSKCGAQTPKWSGRCLDCGAWGTLQESLNKNEKPQKTIEATPGKIINFNEISNQKIERLQTQIDEFDRVMGGGIVPGSLTLLGGEPGIGKSTLILQIAEKISLTSIPPQGVFVQSPLPRRGLGGGLKVPPPANEASGDFNVPPPAEGVRGRVPTICLYVSGE